MRTGRNHGGLIAAALVGLAALGAPALVALPALIVFNPSASAPLGWYGIRRLADDTVIRTDDFVLARLPAEAATLAAQRGYLPPRIPLLKRVAAVAPDAVCIRDHIVRVNGAAAAVVRATDAMGRAMPQRSFCRAMVADEVFLLSSTSGASFDSRYFGPIGRSEVLGVAHPVWIWSAP